MTENEPTRRKSYYNDPVRAIVAAITDAQGDKHTFSPNAISDLFKQFDTPIDMEQTVQGNCPVWMSDAYLHVVLYRMPSGSLELVTYVL
jgi:hypothetical protein